MAHLSVLVRLELLYDVVLLLPGETARHQLDAQVLDLDEVRRRVVSAAAVEDVLVELHLALDVRQVRDAQQVLAVLTAVTHIK